MVPIIVALRIFQHSVLPEIPYVFVPFPYIFSIGVFFSCTQTFFPTLVNLSHVLFRVTISHWAQFPTPPTKHPLPRTQVNIRSSQRITQQSHPPSFTFVASFCSGNCDRTKVAN